MAQRKVMRRRFGTVRKLPSGNFQARYHGPDGERHTIPETYRTKTDAQQALVDVEADMRRGDWIDPDAGKELLVTYARRWVEQRRLSDRSAENYYSYIANHIEPYLGDKSLAALKPPMIRAWRMQLLEAKVGGPTIAKVYRFLKGVLATAVDDELIRRNPCRIKGAGQEHTAERPIATLSEVFAVAASIQPRYRLLVLIATFGQLRFGELIALRKSDITLPARRWPTAEEVEAGANSAELIDDGAPSLDVSRVVSQLNSGQQVLKDPKSGAGERSLYLPAGLLPELRDHLDSKGFTEAGRDGRLFIGPNGAIPRRQNFRTIWKKALEKAQVNPDLHLHDLRHTGGTWSAQSGATLKEVMKRIGHSSTRAAMVYQHATRERDQQIAEALNALIDVAREEGKKPPSERDDGGDSLKSGSEDAA